MSFHGSATVTTHGTSVPLVALTQSDPMLRFCSTVVIQYTGTHNIYGGFGAVAGDVTSSSNGWTLNSSFPAITIGETGAQQNTIDLSSIRIDTDTDGEKVTFTAVQF